MGSGLLEQLAFARFVDRGDFARYLRRVRPIYRARRDATITALGALPDVRWQGAAAGLHLHVTLPGDVDMARLATVAAEHGVLVDDATVHWADPAQAPPSLVLGYGQLSEPTIQRVVSVLATALAASRRDEF